MTLPGDIRKLGANGGIFLSSVAWTLETKWGYFPIAHDFRLDQQPILARSIR